MVTSTDLITVFQQSRQLAIDELDTLYYKETMAAKSSSVDALSVAEDEGKAVKEHCKTLRGKHKASNFTYGDTSFGDFQALLLKAISYLPSKMHSNLHFLDLGCGHGECVIAAALLQYLDEAEAAGSWRFSKVLGVDLLHTKVQECRYTLRHMAAAYIENNPIYSCKPFPEISLIEEDFFSLHDAVWSEASIVYACATCFSPDTLTFIQKTCLEKLSTGSIVILLDKPCHNPEFQYSDEDKSWISEMKQLFSFPCKTSWGTGIAYVYQKS